MFNPFRRNLWRFNIGAGRLRSLELNGVDGFRFQHPSGVLDLLLDPEAGEQLDKAGIRNGDRFVLTGIHEIGSGASPLLSHLVVAKGAVANYSFPARSAKIRVKNFSWIDGEPSARAAPKPKRNIEPLSQDLKTRFLDVRRPANIQQTA